MNKEGTLKKIVCEGSNDGTTVIWE